MKNFLKTFFIVVLLAAINSCNKIEQDNCSNGIQDGTETGVDCGGVCPSCPIPPAPPEPPTPTPTPTDTTTAGISTIQVGGTTLKVVSTEATLSSQESSLLTGATEDFGIFFSIRYTLVDSITNDTSSLFFSHNNDDFNANTLPLGPYFNSIAQADTASEFKYSVLIYSETIAFSFIPFVPISPLPAGEFIELSAIDFATKKASGNVRVSIGVGMGNVKTIDLSYTDVDFIDMR